MLLISKFPTASSLSQVVVERITTRWTQAREKGWHLRIGSTFVRPPKPRQWDISRGSKSENRNPKSENEEVFRISCLFRISSFVFRIFLPRSILSTSWCQHFVVLPIAKTLSSQPFSLLRCFFRRFGTSQSLSIRKTVSLNRRLRCRSVW